jgi:hypothetical protein
MIDVYVGHDVVNPDSWQLYENVSDFGDFLVQDFGPMYGGHFPKTARIYHEFVDQEHDVTPATPDAAEELRKLSGKAYVLVFPAEPVTTSILVNVGVTLGLLAIKFALNAAFPDKKDRTHQIRQGSPNNTLGDRLNTARLGERIPDIYGNLNCTPDLVQFPYIVYENHRQVETTLACIGIGEYEVFTVKEGESFAEDINGMSVRVYPPGEAPGGGTPQGTGDVGPDIDDPCFTCIPIRAVKGDVLLPVNSRTIIGRIRRTERGNLKLNSIGYEYVGAGVGRLIVEWDQTPEEITDKIQVGDQLFVDWQPGNASFLSSTDPDDLVAGVGSPPDLSSTDMIVDGGELLEITAINDTYLGFNSVEILVDVPLSQQAEWAAIATYSPVTGVIYNFISSVTPITGYWHGPFFCDDPGPHPNGQQIYCNFVADRGLFIDDGKNQAAANIQIAVAVYPADASGNISGSAEIFHTTLNGSYVDRTTRAQTFIINSSTPRSDPPGVGLTIQGRFIIYARRVSLTPWRQEGALPPGFEDTPNAFGPFGTTYETKTGLVQDEVRWADCYSMSRPPNTSFGDVTLVHARTVARRDSQQQLRERRLNLRVGRRVRTWDGATLGVDVETTNHGADIFFDILTRPKLGNVPNANIDFVGIYEAFNQVMAHFGDGSAANFRATFDEDNISLEEMLAAVAECCFCVPYRDGDIVKAKADIDTPGASALFNHRNKFPGSEQRSTTFGTDEDYDGIEVQYFDDADDRIKTYFVPREGIANKYRKISVLGVRSERNAAWHAWRAYYRLLFQNTTVEFEALEEAQLRVVRDKILVANNVDPETQDGEVIAISGTTITTSQIVENTDPPYTVFLQHVDDTVESIDVASIPDARRIVLANAPATALVTDPTAGLRTGYILVANSEPAPTAFTVVEKSFKQLGLWNMSAVNYTAAYYLHEGLRFWLQFNINVDRPTLDSGPYECVTSINSGSTGADGVRGTVWIGTTLNDWIAFTPPSYAEGYTKTAWVIKDDSGLNEAGIMCSVESDAEYFGIDDDVDDTLYGMHNGDVYVSYPNFPIGVWTHVALTYDPDTEVMCLYVNGELVDSEIEVPQSTAPAGIRRLFGCFDGVDGLIGRGDDARLYNRVWSAESIRDMYKRTFRQ